VEDAPLFASDPVLLGMLPQIHTIARVAHALVLTECSIKRIVLD
jgi:hypothetical protein